MYVFFPIQISCDNLISWVRTYFFSWDLLNSMEFYTLPGQCWACANFLYGLCIHPLFCPFPCFFFVQLSPEVVLVYLETKLLSIDQKLFRNTYVQTRNLGQENLCVGKKHCAWVFAQRTGTRSKSIVMRSLTFYHTLVVTCHAPHLALVRSEISFISFRKGAFNIERLFQLANTCSIYL